MKTGRIVKAMSGFYYVMSDSNNIIRCRGRGILKNQDINIYVGDNVVYAEVGNDEGVINEILERKNAFIRPPVANVDMMVIVVSATVPKANPLLIDKFIVMALRSGARPILCINKADKGTEKAIKKLEAIYENVCPIVQVSCLKEKGFDKLKNIISKSSIALAGPSGVGKSTIISLLTNRKDLEIGKLSQKTNRGRHTTRHVEIFPIDDHTYIFDTPGFSSFDIRDIDKYELQAYYEDIYGVGQNCKYQDCLHRKEPECKVKDAVEKGILNKDRYESYLYNLNDIENKEKKKY